MAAAARAFEAALKIDPESPPALYDLGVASIAMGDTAEGLRLLARADALACNVFLQYQVVAWRVAVELDVPVVDLVLGFQAQDAGALYLDPAHPNAAAGDVIASALWPAVAGDGAAAAP